MGIKVATSIGLALFTVIAFQNCAGSTGTSSVSSTAAPSGQTGMGGAPGGTVAPAPVYDKTKCSYSLASGANVWVTERYVVHGTGCDNETAVVAANNPAATIQSISAVYVRDDVNSADKNKCTWTLRGANGTRWTTERYLAWGVDCSFETAKVAANNPNATIASVEQNYVYDPKADISKWKCAYQLRSASGATWKVERYSTDSTCASERSIVTANNPNATIVSSSVNFVYDPFL